MSSIASSGAPWGPGAGHPLREHGDGHGQHTSWPFWCLLTVTTLARLLYLGFGRLELSPDEAYYWGWSRHLAFSYFDHPPMVAYVIFLTALFAPYTEFFVRLGATLMATGNTLLTYLIGKELFSERVGFYSALLLNAIPLFSLGAYIMTPDTPQAFFAALLLYTLQRAISTGSRGWWYGSGVAAGLGLLSKYTAVLLLPAVLLFLALSPPQRHWLRRREPYLAATIALLCFLPVLIWNARSQWGSFTFQLSHALRPQTGKGLQGLLDFAGSQAGLLSPLVFLALVQGMVACGYRGAKQQDGRLLLLFSTSAPLLAFFIVMSLFTKIEGNWSSLAYLPACIGTVAVHLGNHHPWTRRLRLLGASVFLTALLETLLIHIQPLYPLVPLPPQLDATTQLAGWKALGKHLQELQKKQRSAGIFLIAARNQLAAALQFYTASQEPIYLPGGRRRYPFWGDLNHLRGRDALYVCEQGRCDDQELERVRSSCQGLAPLEVFPILQRGKLVRRFAVYRCRSYQGGLF